MMKIYAKQVPPEYQESPLLSDIQHEPPENLYIFGNHHFTGCNADEMRKIYTELFEAADDLDGRRRGRSRELSWAETLADILPRESGDWTRADRVRWAHILRDYRLFYTSEKYNIICAGLEMLTGRAWDWRTLRGCVQGDWQYCIYPADEWDAASLERLEAEYFNTGTEWIVHNDQDAPDSPEDIDGFSVYCTGWNDDQIRKEIADAAGGRPEDVTLYQFTGYTRRAEYEEVI
jgi:hypothetical protein